MSQTLKGLCAEVSADGLNGTPPRLNLLHRETGKLVTSLPIRNACPTDRSFILATWVRSYAAVAKKLVTSLGTAPSIRLEPEVFLAEEPIVAESHWAESLVVGSDTDEFTIHGWVCGCPGELLHAYVPPDLRKQGIAKALISYLCGPTIQYARPWPFPKVPAGWTYNPYLLRP